MKIRVFLAGVLCAVPVHARVLDLHTEIRLEKSGELTITERITVEARKDTPRLERELPPGVRVVDLVRDGHPDSYAMDGSMLRAGGALTEGRHLYQVTYRAGRRIAFLGDHDALHWNLKGAQHMTAEVILPASVPSRQIKAEVVTSAPSAQGGEYQSFVRDGRAAFRSEQPIAFVVRFPKGVIAEPGIGERAGWFFSDYFGMVVVAALLAFTALVLHRIRLNSAP